MSAFSRLRLVAMGVCGALVAVGSGVTSGQTIPQNLPRISFFEPAVGVPGDRILAQGANFLFPSGSSNVSKLIFINGVEAEIEQPPVNANQFYFRVPRGVIAATENPQLGPVFGEATRSVNTFTTVTAPAILQFNPNRGEVGATVTLSGRNFLTTRRVTFKDRTNVDIPAEFRVESNDILTAVVPPGAVTAPIGVDNRAGVATTFTDFTVVVPPGAPTIASVSPVRARAGAAVRIFGTNFVDVERVQIGKVPVRFDVLSPEEILMVVPAGTIPAKPIRVRAAGGRTRSLEIFTVLP